MYTPGYTQLEATEIADGAREAWTAAIGDTATGRVIRVFDRTAYLAFEEDTRPQPRVLMLGTAAIPHGPLLVSTDAGPGFAFSAHLEPGDDCRLRPEDGNGDGYMLSVGRTLDIAVPSTVLAIAPTTPPSVRPLTAIEQGGPVCERSRAVLRTVREAGIADGLGWLEKLDEGAESSPGGRFQQVAATWIDLLEREQPRTVDITPITRMVGLGPGATPSGDDILSGILLTLARTTAGKDRETVQHTAERIIRQSTEATTTMSLALMEQAAHGRAPAAVEDCLTALLEEEPPQACREAATAVAAIGHYSGADALAGIITTLLVIALRIEGDRNQR